VPGIMPITNFTQLARFSDACGAEIPRWIRRRLESFGDDRESIRAFGQDVVTGLCEQLLAADAPGLHFYTMNQADATLALWERRRQGIPAQRFGTPEEFGATCAFLCSQQAGYINGQNLLLDGGAYPGTF